MPHQVVLPTFILEKRSLLEMYADFMSHPDLFVAITDGSSPEDRMVRFVEYYLTSFHEGRKGAIAKKPYNPIIGETFHCSWRVPRVPDASQESSQGSPEPAATAQEPYQVRFVAEQVSHHPPVSGFYAECQERKMCVNTHVWTKSKFMGMSIGVSMIGEGEPARFMDLESVLQTGGSGEDRIDSFSRQDEKGLQRRGKPFS